MENKDKTKINESGIQEIKDLLENIYRRHVDDRAGNLADYIPELATVDPDRFGMAVVTETGVTAEVGDALHEFTIQSISKPITYCIAVEALGAQAVTRFVGVEPSGDPFNAIEMDPRTDRPFNPMVNAGAIAVSAALYQRLGDDTFDHILARLGAAAGRPLRIDQRVYESERATGHRNRAIGHLLRSLGIVECDVDAALDVYFRQCSILVSARDLATIGATLANVGENPTTGRVVFAPPAVRDTLSVMAACGMYNHSGAWLHRVGLPAKSGVGGGVIGVVNRQLGIGTFSPRLDAKGNSVRGLEAFADLTEELGLHMFDPFNRASAFVGALLARSVVS